MSCLNLTGKPQTTAQAAEAKRVATEAAKARAARYAKQDTKAGTLSIPFERSESSGKTEP